MLNPVQRQTGAAAFSRPFGVMVLILLAAVFGWVIALKGFVIAVILIGIPFVVFLLGKIFGSPKLSIYVVVFIGFFALGLSRYISGPPYGLTVDGILLITYIAIFFKYFYKHLDWSPAKKDVTYLALVWYGYAILEFFNPEAHSRIAWFYAMRGVALYMLLMVPLVLLLLRDYKDLNKFLYLWAILSLLGSIKGFMQINFGVDPWEKAWLDNGGAATHILFGKLRVFSFYSDAGQFGASQGHAGVMGTIVALHSKKMRDKIFFGFVALASFYGMFISGTRGAIAVPFAGFFLYIILIRNTKLVTLGVILGISIFVFFKYTTIGNNVYAINRMRTAFNPEDNSLQVRLENQRKLKAYLASRPIGGGIGSAGYWGRRFAPNTFLANIPTDSWYVMIWADQGIVGLTLHLLILFYIVGKGSYLAMFKVHDRELQGKLFALAAGIFGIMAASYGNGVLGQLPTGPLIYISMAFLFESAQLQKSLDEDRNIHSENPILNENN